MAEASNTEPTFESSSSLKFDPPKMSSYTVQVLETAEIDGIETRIWRDIATVELPMRSHRKSAIKADSASVSKNAFSTTSST